MLNLLITLQIWVVLSVFGMVQLMLNLSSVISQAILLLIMVELFGWLIVVQDSN